MEESVPQNDPNTSVLNEGQPVAPEITTPNTNPSPQQVPTVAPPTAQNKSDNDANQINQSGTGNIATEQGRIVGDIKGDYNENVNIYNSTNINQAGIPVGDQQKFQQAINNFQNLDRLGSTGNNNQNVVMIDVAGLMHGLSKPEAQVNKEGPRLRKLPIEQIRATMQYFVEFQDSTRLFERCRTESLVFVQGSDDALVDQVMQYILIQAARDCFEDDCPIYSVGLRKGLSDFRDSFPEELTGAWYALLDAPRRIISELTPDIIEHINDNLKQTSSHLIIKFESNMELPTSVLGKKFYRITQRPSSSEVIAKVIERSELPPTEQEVLKRQVRQSNNEEWIEKLNNLTSLKELYILGDDVVNLWIATPEDKKPNLIDNLLVNYRYHDVMRWFEDHPDLSERAFMITLSVLDGTQPEELDYAYRELLKALGNLPYRRLKLEEVFAISRVEHLINNDVGLRAVQVIGFKHPSLYGLVLLYIWRRFFEDDYTLLQGIVLWLRRLATDRYPRIRELVALAIGTISYNNHFTTVEQMFILELVEQGAQSYRDMLKAQEARTQIRQVTASHMVEAIEDEELTEDDKLNAMGQTLEAGVRLDATLQQHEYEKRKRFQEMQEVVGRVIGNILMYCVESGNRELEREVKSRVVSWANVAHLEQFKKGSAEYCNVEYEHKMALAFYFYAGGYMLRQALDDIRAIARDHAQRENSEIQDDLTLAFFGTLRGRLRRPGDPRADIVEMFKLLDEWYTNKSEYLRSLAREVIIMLSREITEPYRSVHDSSVDLTKNPLLKMRFTDWPILLYLSYHSQELENYTTKFVRALVGRRDEIELYDQVVEIRDVGYAILRHWMLFAVGYNQPSLHIKRVDEPEPYQLQIWRVCLGILARLPSAPTRTVMLKRFKKIARKEPELRSIVDHLINQIEHSTNEDGSPVQE